MKRTTSTLHRTWTQLKQTFAQTRSRRARLLDRLGLEQLESRQMLSSTLHYAEDFEAGAGAEWSNNTTSAAPSSITQLLGQFSNQTVALSLDSLQTHESVTVEFDLYTLNSWDGNAPPSIGPDRFQVQVDGEFTPRFDSTFSNIGGDFYDQSYPLPFADSDAPRFDARTGSIAQNTLGGIFFGDSTYRISITIPHTDSALTLNFTALNLENISNESWGLDNVKVWTNTSSGVPNLTIDPGSVSAPSQAVLGDPVNLSFQITNDGDGEADAVGMVFLSQDDQLDQNDIALPSSELLINGNILSGGGTVLYISDYTLPRNFPAGPAYLLFIADPTKTQPDSDPANNMAAIPLNLVEPLEMATTPANGSKSKTYPGTLTVNFNHPIDDSSLDASDLTVDGIAAASVTKLEEGIYEFDVSNADDGSTDKVFNVAMAAGAVVSSEDGLPVKEYAGTFAVDNTGPSLQYAYGAIDYEGRSAVVIGFDEPVVLHPESSTPLYIVNLSTYQTFFPTSTSTSPGSNEVTFYFDAPEGDYQYYLSGNTSDEAGNLLNGAVEGTYSSSVNIEADGSVPVKPLLAAKPDGSQVYQRTIRANVQFPGDVDEFRIDIKAGQLVSLWFEGDQSNAVALLELLNPNGEIVATVNDGTVLNSDPLAVPGLYTIRVTSYTQGLYNLHIRLNAQFETESTDPNGESYNGEIWAAQNIDATSISFGSVDRLAVAGWLGYWDTDTYQFSVTPGQFTTIAFQANTYNGITINVFDSDGTQITSASSFFGEDGESLIRIPNIYTNGDSLFVQVIGSSGGGEGALPSVSADADAYHLVAIRNGDIEQGSNRTGYQAQPLGPNTTVYGSLRHGGSSAYGYNYSVTETESNDVIYWANDLMVGSYPSGPGSQFASGSGELTAGDQDWYRIVAGPDDVVNVEFYTSFLNGATITLYDRNSVALGSMQVTPESGGSAYASFDLTKYTDGYYGNYYVQIKDDSGATGLYNLNVYINSPFEGGGDFYRVAVDPGQTVTFSTATPGSAWNLDNPRNDLYPGLVLYDIYGNYLDSQYYNAGDGRNSQLVLTNFGESVAEYIIGVVAADGSGDYILTADGAAAQTQSVSVEYTSPSNGDTFFASFPGTFEVNFTAPIDFSSVDPSDLVINGIGVNGWIELVDANTIRFDISGMAAGDNDYTFEIADGAITGLQGQPVFGTTGTFTFASGLPHVTSSSISQDETVGAGELYYTATFNTPMYSGSITTDDVRLYLLGTATVINATGVALSEDGLTLTAVFANVPDGAYRLELVSSYNAFYGTNGLLLDGYPSSPLPSGDGIAGDNFQLNFNADQSTAAYPAPLAALKPEGSLVYDPPVSASLYGEADVDEYTIDIEAGQKIAIVFTTTSLVQGRVELKDAADNLLASGNAVGTGASLVVQPGAMLAGGTYRLVVSSLSGAGNYTLQVALNAVIEEENLGGAINDSSDTAVDLEPSAISLTGSADRLAALGVADGEDWYRVNLTAGQFATFALTALNGSTLLSLELYSPTGTLLSAGSVTSINTGPRIDDFLAPADGEYRLRVQGPDNIPYNLLAVRGAAFESEQNGDVSNADAIGHTLTVLGSLQSVGEPIATESEPNDSIATADDLTGSFQLESGNTYVAKITGVISTSYEGDYTRITAAPGDVLNLDEIGTGISDTYLYLYDRNGTLLAYNDDYFGLNSHITYTIPANGYSGDYFIRSAGYSNRTGSYRTEVRITTNNGLGGRDSFSFDAVAGQILNISTLTPGDGTGEPTNVVDPKIELYNELDQIVATDDNSGADGRNALLNYTVPEGTGGKYKVIVSGSVGSAGGAYVLQITGASTGGVAPSVVASLPTDGGSFVAPPSYIDVTFSENIRIDSVDPSDLTLEGGTVSSVQAIDGRNFRFFVSGDTNDGTYSFSIAAGAVQDLQGQDNTAFSASYLIDTVGPRVVSVTPTGTVNAPFSSLTFTFSEALQAASVSVSDIVSFTNPGGTSILGGVSSVQVSGANLTVNFNQQYTEGTYTIVIGPNINDTAGGAMDQDQDNVRGEATDDRYTAQFSVYSPDLVGSNVQVQSGGSVVSSASFGQVVTVTYTTTNNGNAATTATWYDEIYLERISDNYSVYLGYTTTSGLAGLASVDRSLDVTLPLNVSLNDGQYRIRVNVDAYNYQFETNNSNNSATSTPVTITRPPLPNLAVTNIVAPLETYAGQPLEISWTTSNIGTGDVTSSYYERVYLSSDAFIGSDIFLGEYNIASNLPAGQSQTRTQTVTFPVNLQGNYRLVVYTDYYNQITELNGETDGTNSAIDDRNVLVLRPPIPNLIVTTVTPPLSSFSGTQTTVEWTVKNIGTGATSSPTWYDAVYLSLDATLSNDDTYLGLATNPTYLAVDDSYLNSLQVTLPTGVSGTRYFIVKTDYYNNVNEVDASAENDNINQAQATITLTPPPDLQVTVVSAPDLALSGQPVSINWTVKNLGTGGTIVGSWWDRVYLSLDDTFSAANDTLLGTYFYGGGALGVNGQYSMTQTPTLPVGISGPYYFFVLTDAFDNVYEHANNNNNFNNDSNPTQVNLTPPPDLELEPLSAPANARAGAVLNFSYEVFNFGSDATPNSSWNDKFFLSTDQILDAGDYVLGEVNHFGALDVDGSYSRNVGFTLPNGLTGAFWIIGHTDSGNVVFELNNTNNIRVSSSQVLVNSLPADLIVTGITAPTNAESGTNVLVQWTVKNQGIGDTITGAWVDSLYGSIDDVVGNFDDVYLGGLTHNGVLGVNATYNASLAVTLPLSWSGAYRLFVRTDTNANVYEGANEGNNYSTTTPIDVVRSTADLQVTEVTPALNVASGQNLSVSYTVRNFGAKATNVNSWNDRVYLSTNTIFDNSDTQLGLVTHIGALAALDQYSVTRGFTVPIDFNGSYYVIVVADADASVYEADAENNNSRAAAQTTSISLSAVPDLVIENVSSPDIGYAGQPIQIDYRVRNQGSVPATGNWYDTVYLSRDQVLDNSDTYLGYASRGLQTLNGGDFYDVTTTMNIPNGFSGPYYVFIRADAGNSVYERTAGEANNTSFDPTSMTVNLQPPADLVVGSFNVPSNANVGAALTIDFTIQNNSSNAALGSWWDSLYLSSDDAYDVGDKYLGRVLHTGGVAANGSYNATLNTTLPGASLGSYRILVRSDIFNNLPESNEGNNLGASLNSVQLDVPALELNVTTPGSLPPGGYAYYRVEVPAGESLEVVFDSSSPTASNDLYVRFGDMPTLARFDAGPSNPLSPDQTAIIDSTRGGTYYIMAHNSGNSGAPTSFTIRARVLDFEIRDVVSDRGSNLGKATTIIQGSKFDADAVVSLIASDGTRRVAEKVRWVNRSEMWATFDLRGLATGLYDIEVAQDGRTVVSEDAYTVNNGRVGSVRVSVSTPNSIRPGQPASATVTFINSGETDVASPILQLVATNALLSDPSKPGSPSTLSSITFLGVDTTGAAGILSPGESGEIIVPFVPTTALGQATFSLYNVTSTNAVMDWTSQQETLRPANISAEAWAIIFANFKDGVGSELWSYQQALADNATHLSQIGQVTSDISRLVEFEFQQAMGLLPAVQYETQTDLLDTTPGLELSLARVYSGSIAQRFQTGALGRGWSHQWEVSAAIDPAGNVTIVQPGGNRIFTTLGGGLFSGQVGDQGTLTKVGTSLQLLEADGTLTVFDIAGRLNYMQDRAGNRITATFTAGQLTALTHTNGDAINLTYNVAGRLVSATDSTGKTVTYSYDASNQYLLSVTTAEGTTNYSYQTNALLRSVHALTGISYPGGRVKSFAYDSKGRLQNIAQNGGLESYSYAYDTAAGLTVTDATDVKAFYLYDDRLLLGQFTDELGRGAVLRFDDKGQLTRMTNPGGGTYQYTYDSHGNLTSILDPAGRLVQTTYDPTTNLVTQVRDGRNNATQFTYDAEGNLSRITYPNGTHEDFVSNGSGERTSQTNRRGQALSYTYNNNGLVTSMTFADSSVTTFGYDARGNLTSVTDSTGTTTYQYDAADRITRIDYPDSRYLIITRDAAGRRTQTTDQTGYVQNYTYNSTGKLSAIRDGSNQAIVTYAYDAAGRLTSETRSNGTVATYSYDEAGQLLSIITEDASSAVISEAIYTRDLNGRPKTLTTLDGTWTYSYDGIGQITSALFASTNVNIADQDLSFQYDAAGNRIKTIVNGVETSYSTNSLNQYTAVGGDTFTYDADGNLIGRVSGGENFSYTYDQLNRLVSTTTPDGTWGYEYNGLGQRVATQNGANRTEYTNDVYGYGYVNTEYDGLGNVTARNIVGQGVDARLVNGGLYFYDNDAVGNTLSVSGSGGVVANYTYLPFGQVLYAQSSLANPMQMNGQYGVTDEGNGLTNMRARYYDASLGRFISQDPASINGGLNLYGFANNSPTVNIDPTGLWYVNIGISGGFIGGGTIGIIIGSDGLYGYAGAGLTTPGVGISVTGSHQDPSTGWGVQVQGAVGPGVAGVAGSVSKSFDDFGDPSKGWGYEVGGGAGLGGSKATGIGGFITYTGKLWDWGPGKKPNNPNPDPNNPADDNSNTDVVRPRDPNDILGPANFGDLHWTADGTWNYTIRFENAADATAPAQQVVITQYLDSDLDWRTFRVDDFGWGGTDGFVQALPANRGFYSGRIDFTDELGFVVDVNVSLDLSTGLATWTITTIDPETGEVPLDPSIGFLLPDDEAGRGDGFVSYTIRPKTVSSTGTRVDAEARIVFDGEAPIDTPAIFNTLDDGVPFSAVDPLPASSEDPNIAVSWSGDDVDGGSGLASYDIFVAINGGAFTLWLDDTTLTESVYVGELGNSYAFFSVARDNAGNIEAEPASADATITLSGGNEIPTLPSIDDATITEGDTFSLEINFNDPDTDTWSGTVDFGDGAVALTIDQAEKKFALSKLFAQNGVYDVTVTLDDGNGGTAIGTFQITVNNAAPVLNTISDKSGVVGSTISFSVDFTDVGLLDTHSASVDWGDGVLVPVTVNPVTRSISGSTVYASEGTRTVTLYLTDSDGDSTSTSFTTQSLLSRVNISTTDAQAGEPDTGLGNGQFRITRDLATPGTLDVGFVIGGLANYGVDYDLSFVNATLVDYNPLSRSGLLRLNAGNDPVLVNVNVNDDGAVEGSEKMSFTLQARTGYVLGTAAGSLDIIDDDGTELSIKASKSSTREDQPAKPGEFEIRRSIGTVNPLHVPFRLSGLAALGEDFTWNMTGGTIDSFNPATGEGELVLNPGSGVAKLTLTPVDDEVAEGNEDIKIIITSSPSYAIRAKLGSATVKVVDDDVMVISTKAKKNAEEGAPIIGQFSIESTIVSSTDRDISFKLDGSALLGTDYNVSATGGTLVSLDTGTGEGIVRLPAGSKVVTLLVTPEDDALSEGVENVRLSLVSDSDYLIAASGKNATMQIVDDELARVSLVTRDNTTSEPGYDNALLDITRLGGAIDQPLQVSFKLSGTAGLGTEYSVAAIGGKLLSLNTVTGVGVIELAAGSSKASLVLQAIAQALPKAKRKITVDLLAGTYQLGTAKANVTLAANGL